MLEIASKLAMIPEIAGGSITSYAGGALGQDSIRVGTAVRARGLVPNVHQTCVGQDRKTIDKILVQLQALEMHNIFAISGDWPKAAMRTAVFDIDSVQLAAHIAELRARTGTPFFISCAVSPFKYQREDLLYQYLKLEKKIAAGANMAITQVGWDAAKFVELKKYLDERGIKTPVLGNVFVLSRRAAERMNTGNPPGCWASDELVAVLKKESEAPDGGLQARLERARAIDRDPQRDRLRRRLHRRHARREPHPLDDPPRRGARAEVGGALRGAAVRQEGRLLSVQARPAAEAGAHVPAHGDGRGRQGAAVRAVVEERTKESVGEARDRRRLPLARQASAAQSLVRAVRVLREEGSLRLPELRQLRARFHGVRVPADVPEADAQRAVRRHLPRRVRGHRPGVHLGQGDGARRSVEHDRSAEGLHPAARSRADRHGVVGELLPWSRQQAGPSEGSLAVRRPGPHRADRRRRAAQDRRAVGRRQGAGGADAAEAGGKSGKWNKWKSQRSAQRRAHASACADIAGHRHR